MLALQPIALAASTMSTILFDDTVSPQPVQGLIIQNQSGFNVTVTAPYGTHTIGPWINDYVPVDPATTKSVTVLPNAYQISFSTNPQLLVTLVWITDPKPVGYPSTGFIANVSSPAILYQSPSLTLPNGSGLVNSPYIDVSIFESILVMTETSVATDCTVSLSWSNTGIGPGQQLSQLDNWFKNSSNVNSVVPIHVLAPWVQIFVENSSIGVTSLVSIIVVGVPKGSNTGFITPTSTVLDVQNANFTSGDSIYPSIYIPGKYKLWFQCNGTASVGFGIAAWRGGETSGSSGASWDYLYTGVTSATAAGVNPPLDIYLPASDWRVSVSTTCTQLYFSIVGPVN